VDFPVFAKARGGVMGLCRSRLRRRNALPLVRGSRSLRIKTLSAPLCFGGIAGNLVL
jgi:hypothetical protein